MSQYLRKHATGIELDAIPVLIVDTCGRGGEFVLNAARPKHMCLMWKDIELYSFQNVEDNAFDIRINVTINWSKNDTLDDSKYKTIPLVRLLPILMVSEELTPVRIETK